MTKLVCAVVGHRFGLFKSFRLCPSVVHEIRCHRCGEQKGSSKKKKTA